MPKRIAPLSDIQINKAKTAPKEYKMFDGVGLFLLVTPTGGKLWHFKYRFNGKEKKLSFGAYPAVSLAGARKRRDDAKELLANDIDPGEAKKAQKAAKIAETENSFEAVTREWHVRFKQQWTANHAERLLTRLEHDALPFIGSRPIGEIKAPEML